MMLNKKLLSMGYMFVKNVDPQYLNMLYNIGVCPIFTQVYPDKRIIMLKKFNLHPQLWFNYEKCTISDIKFLLSVCKLYSFTLNKSWLPNSILILTKNE